MKKFEIEPLKVMGIFATIVGVAASALNSYVEEKKLDIKVDEKVRKALAEQSETNEE